MLVGEDADVEEQNGDLGEEEGEHVVEDCIPACLITEIRTGLCQLRCIRYTWKTLNPSETWDGGTDRYPE